LSLAKFQVAIQPVHYLANMLHPRYRGAKLSVNQLEEARQWIADSYPELLPLVINFHTSDDATLYTQSFFTPKVTSKLDPVSWWKSLKKACKTLEIQKLADIVIHLLSSPASSASVERVYFSFGTIHMKLRNCLCVERAAKLVFCYHMLRGNNPEDDY